MTALAEMTPMADRAADWMPTRRVEATATSSRRLLRAYLDRVGEPTLTAYLGTAALTGLLQRRRGLTGLVARRVAYPYLFAQADGLAMMEDVIVRGFRRIRLGTGVMIEQGVLLDAKSDRALAIVIGDRTSLRRGCRLDTGFHGSITIGAGSMVAGELLGSFGITLGDGVLMAAGATVVSGNHVFIDRATPITDQGIDGAPVHIGDGAWLGAGSVVLPGVSVGAGAVVAANAVVTRNVAAGIVVGGIPARPIGADR